MQWRNVTWFTLEYTSFTVDQLAADDTCFVVQISYSSYRGLASLLHIILMRNWSILWSVYVLSQALQSRQWIVDDCCSLRCHICIKQTSKLCLFHDDELLMASLLSCGPVVSTHNTFTAVWVCQDFCILRKF